MVNQIDIGPRSHFSYTMKCFNPPATWHELVRSGILTTWPLRYALPHKTDAWKKGSSKHAGIPAQGGGLELGLLQGSSQPKAFYDSMIQNVVKDFMARLVWRRKRDYSWLLSTFHPLTSIATPPTPLRFSRGRAWLSCSACIMLFSLSPQYCVHFFP